MAQAGGLMQARCADSRSVTRIAARTLFRTAPRVSRSALTRLKRARVFDSDGRQPANGQRQLHIQGLKLGRFPGAPGSILPTTRFRRERGTQMAERGVSAVLNRKVSQRSSSSVSSTRAACRWLIYPSGEPLVHDPGEHPARADSTPRFLRARNPARHLPLRIQQKDAALGCVSGRPP